MANHRNAGRATVRKHRTVGGTHRDSAVPMSLVKASVLGVLATATIAAPLAAAAAGIDQAAPQGETIAAAQPAAVAQPAVAAAPVALPSAEANGALEVRAADGSADRSEQRTSPAAATSDASEADAAAKQGTGIEVSIPAPEPEPAPVAEKAAGATGSAAAPAGSSEEPASDAASTSSGYLRPVSGPITSGYGGRVHPVLGYFKGHDGVDFGAACGAPVHAAKSGTVIAVEYHHASGNRVKIDHGNGVVTGYYHLQGFNTSVGATVGAGDTIGYVGSTGRSTGCHLHFAKMDEAGNYSNPMSILR